MLDIATRLALGPLLMAQATRLRQQVLLAGDVKQCRADRIAREEQASGNDEHNAERKEDGLSMHADIDNE